MERNKKGQFIKGCLAPKTAFKKGQIPYNKGIKGIIHFPNRKGHPNSNKGKELLHLRGKNASHWQGGKKKKICIVCGKEFDVDKYRGNTSKFCSKRCNALWRTGSKAANWKGGVDLENKRIRRSLEYEIWRNEVYKRDNWTCRICGKKCKAKDIVAHHLQLFSEYPELRFSIDNGITLCRSCHKKIHKEIGIKTRFK